MSTENEPARKLDEGQPGITRTITAVIATLVVLTVLMVTIRSQEPIGAGIYYDDGAYLALARSMARGRSHTVACLSPNLTDFTFASLINGAPSSTRRPGPRNRSGCRRSRHA